MIDARSAPKALKELFAVSPYHSRIELHQRNFGLDFLQNSDVCTMVIPCHTDTEAVLSKARRGFFSGWG